MLNPDKLTVSEFIDLCNQTLDYAYANITVEGEVASFKINQNKWVFFDLKDDASSISCFLPAWNLRAPLADGMKIIVRGTPKLTKWGKFSLTVQQIAPVGEGSIKKSFELLKRKLSAEGLFATERKRPIPTDLSRIGVISSTAAAGYADFIKILNERWGGLDIKVAHTQVQGLDAPDQIIRALHYFNEHTEVDIIAILRGGGSADDLSAFNDEQLTRTIAASRIPIITGIGHEVDESLADLAADVRASTPSNAAQLLTRDRRAEIARLHDQIHHAGSIITERINHCIDTNRATVHTLSHDIVVKITTQLHLIQSAKQTLSGLNPEQILKQGYAIISGKISPGNVVKITTSNQLINAEIINVKSRT